MANLELVEISKDELKKIGIVGGHLHTWQGKGKSGIKAVIDYHQRIQLDPLNPAGRQHDIFCLSRIPDYTIGSFEQYAYENKWIFEYYDTGLQCALNMDLFPHYYSIMSEDHAHAFTKKNLKLLSEHHPKAIDTVLGVVKKKQNVSSTEIKGLVDKSEHVQMWKSNRLASSVLEILFRLGKVTVSKRDSNFRKLYDLTENYIPNDFFSTEKVDEEYWYRHFKIRQSTFPLMKAGKIKTLKSGRISYSKRDIKQKWFSKEDGPILATYGSSNSGFVIPENWESLLKQKIDYEVRIIAPLDPLIWDRDILLELFDFDYKWEVYKPAKDRIWGYYVYPLMYEGEFVGRLEGKYDSDTETLNIFNFIKESNFETDNKFETKLSHTILRWQKSIKGLSVNTDKSVPVEIDSS